MESFVVSMTTRSPGLSHVMSQSLISVREKSEIIHVESPL